MVTLAKRDLLSNTWLTRLISKLIGPFRLLGWLGCIKGPRWRRYRQRIKNSKKKKHRQPHSIRHYMARAPTWATTTPINPIASSTAPQPASHSSRDSNQPATAIAIPTVQPHQSPLGHRLTADAWLELPQPPARPSKIIRSLPLLGRQRILPSRTIATVNSRSVPLLLICKEEVLKRKKKKEEEEEWKK